MTKDLQHLVAVGQVGGHCSMEVCSTQAMAAQQAELHRMTLLTHQTRMSLRSASHILLTCM